MGSDESLGIYSVVRKCAESVDRDIIIERRVDAVNILRLEVPVDLDPTLFSKERSRVNTVGDRESRLQRVVVPRTYDHDLKARISPEGSLRIDTVDDIVDVLLDRRCIVL